jgi:hypothetical protein
MRTPNPLDEQLRLRQRAKDRLLLAAAALTQITTDEVLGFAVFHAALGLLLLAQSDPKERGLDVARRMLEARRKELAVG